jgi:hypothetical protein
VRFRYVGSGSLFTGVGAADGVYIDGVTVTDSSLISAETVTPLPGDASGFDLDVNTAGQNLREGDTYFLRVRPVLGCKVFPFGAAKPVSVGPAVSSGFDYWMLTNHAGLAESGFDDDPDGDGIPNGAEYAFGLNPAQGDALPSLVRAGNILQLRFDPSGLAYDTSDIIYGAEHSADLGEWLPITSSDPAGAPVFDLPAGERGFARWSVAR